MNSAMANTTNTAVPEKLLKENAKPKNDSDNLVTLADTEVPETGTKKPKVEHENLINSVAKAVGDDEVKVKVTDDVNVSDKNQTEAERVKKEGVNVDFAKKSVIGSESSVNLDEKVLENYEATDDQIAAGSSQNGPKNGGELVEPGLSLSTSDNPAKVSGGSFKKVEPGPAPSTLKKRLLKEANRKKSSEKTIGKKLVKQSKGSFKMVGKDVVGRNGATPLFSVCPSEGEDDWWSWVETIVHTKTGPELKLIPGQAKSPHTPVGATVGRFSVSIVDERSCWEKLQDLMSSNKEQAKKKTSLTGYLKKKIFR